MKMFPKDLLLRKKRKRRRQLVEALVEAKKDLQPKKQEKEEKRKILGKLLPMKMKARTKMVLSLTVTRPRISEPHLQKEKQHPKELQLQKKLSKTMALIVTTNSIT